MAREFADRQAEVAAERRQEAGRELRWASSRASHVVVHGAGIRLPQRLARLSRSP